CTPEGNTEEAKYAVDNPKTEECKAIGDKGKTIENKKINQQKKEKRERDEKELRQFQKWFKQLGMTLEEAYGEFMGELQEQREQEVLAEECTMFLQRKLPPKREDPGRFTVSCCIGKTTERALSDLGASISLMPLSFLKKWNLGKLSTTETMELVLVDQSTLKP
ncbi:hypothetical protein A2U01_0031926, partial [Trifolium medium]|nr:hypothetical protein [Trifolium medium]